MGSLCKHEASKGHKERVNVMKNKSLFNPVNFTKQYGTIETKKAEIMLSAAVGCHCAIKNIECFGEIVKAMGGENVSNLSIKRTKCTAIIKNVISAQFKHELKENMSDRPFAVLIDESTDVACSKILAVCVGITTSKKNQFLLNFWESQR